MTKPSDYVVDINDAFLTIPRYVTAGDENQDALKMVYTWDIKLGDRSEVDNLLVTYVITCPSGKTHQIAESKNYGDRLDTSNPLNLYNYLESGVNQIDIRFKAQNTGAEKNVRLYITVMEFSIESTFQYYNRVDVADSFVVPVILNRNITSQSANIYVSIDGQLASINGQNAGLPYTVNAGVTGVTYLNINNAEDQETGLRPYRGSTANENIQHTMQIWAETTYNNVTFRSNLLFYTFEVKSELVLANKFINLGINCSSAQVAAYPLGSLTIYGTQYVPITIPWGYYTDSLSYDTAVTIDWKLAYSNKEELLASLKGETGTRSVDLTFIPDICNQIGDIYLRAYHGQELLLEVPMYIACGSSQVVTPNGMALELSAYSKSNNTDDKNVWTPVGSQANVTLSQGIKYNTTSGWHEHALRVSGETEYATIDYNIFDESVYSIQEYGRTVEFEFEAERVNSDNDIIMMLGKSGEARIEVTPNSAMLYDNSNNMVIKTNFKANERVKMAFILNPSSATEDNQLIYISTLGVLERGSTGNKSFGITNGGIIKIGGAASGIKFYKLRVWNYAIGYMDEYNNFVYDSSEKTRLLANNNVMKNGIVNYDLCKAKLPTLLIRANDLSDLLSGKTDKEQSTTNGDVIFINPWDSTKNFELYDAQLRKAGQSTLSYPLTSLRVWTNKKFNPANENDMPRFVCEGQSHLGLAKNRYKMKNNSIPTNKLRLQANYADSSGVNNGGTLRIINDSWYNALVDGKYVLRTIPQLVSSVSKGEKESYGLEHVWNDHFNNDFPTPIRTAPDSQPIVIFYQNGEGEITFLGQYVMMEEKKADFCFGERSIYKADPTDPFCLTVENKKADTASNRLWNNSNALRMEVLDINNVFVSFMNWVKDGVAFDELVPEKVVDTTDSETGEVTHSVVPAHYAWEDSFEMIYPDPDDLDPKTADEEKFGSNSKFVAKAQSFIDFVKWLTDCRNNYSIATEWWQANTYNSSQAAFNATARDHIDVYKWAGYYIPMLILGAVDSCERNLQICTDDGIHFYPKLWDWDILLGARGDGGIAFEPPIDRNTRLGNGYAFSGRSTNTSNFLWDSLEGWGEWINTIVPKVAQAMYVAGFNYDNLTRMYDEEYADKWGEVIYNKSGYYKYVVRGGGSQMYLNWLQGARKLHRHWWLSKSMNYYSAKWGFGGFNDSRIDLYAGHQGVENSEEYVTIHPNEQTYFKMMLNETTNLGTKSASRILPARYNVGPLSFQPKTPTYIYGANFIEKLDLSVIAPTFARVILSGSYDKVLGAPIKELNVGCDVTQVDENTYNGILNIADPGVIETVSGEGADKVYPLTNLQTLNIRGQLGRSSDANANTSNIYTTFDLLRDTVDNRGDLSQVKNLYAMGSGIVNFMSAAQGNQFDNLELPSTVYSLNLNNTSWTNISFWNTEANGSNATFTRYNVGEDSSLFVPTGIHELVLNGTTGHSLNSKTLVMAWINGIIAELGDNPTEADINNALSDKVLRMNDVRWDTNTCGNNLLTYNELSLIAKIGTLELKGYIMLASELDTLTSEQLTQLTQWFGDDIFTYSSSGLIIDYDLNTTIISVSGDVTVDNNHEVHLKEGHTAILNATRFHLSNEANDVIWTIRERILDGNGQPIETIAGDMVRSCVLDTTNPRQILLKAMNSENEAYDIFVHSSLGNAEIVVHIDPTDYPTLAIETTEDRARINDDEVILYGGGVSDNFSVVVKSAAEGAVGVQGVSWSIKLSDDTIVSANLITDPNTYKTVDNTTVLNYKRGLGRFDIALSAGLAGADEEIYSYTLIASVNLVGKTTTLTKKVVVMNDLSPIVRADGSYLYLALNTLYDSIYGESADVFYRSTLMGMTGTLDFSPYPNIGRLAVSTNKSILYYLHRVTGVVLDGCTLLENTFDNGGVIINQMDFSKMAALQSLSLQGCTGLTEDIDLSECGNIDSVDLRSTELNVILPAGTSVTSVKLGTPTEFTLVRPTALSASNLSIEDNSDLDTVEIEDGGNINAFRLFGKLTS
ncbi:MAG: hypothetical protein K6D91_05975 [Prevotella sp.]|nr:hypothetical protein [Prevotella sp.]